MAVEKTLVIVKPDGVRRRLTGKFYGDLSKRAWILYGLKSAGLVKRWPRSITSIMPISPFSRV